MQLQLLRDKAADNYTNGKLSVNGVYECFTLELELGDGSPGFAILPGTYPVQIRWSNHFQKTVPHIDNVPGRTEVEIHDGNFPSDTKGCVLVGQARLGDDALLRSDLARQALQSKIAQAQARGEAITIEVVDPPVNV